MAGNYLYVAAGYAFLVDDNTSLKIVDVKNPQAPALTGNYRALAGIYGAYVHNDNVYLACGWSGLQILDITHPVQPKLVGACNTENA